MVEFQVVILCGVEEATELFPLINTVPKSLLPVANIENLHYQLEYFYKVGFSSIFLVVPQNVSSQIKLFVTDYLKKNNKMEIIVKTCPKEDNTSTISMLHSVKDDIKTNVIIVKDGIITNLSLHDVTDLHRVEDSSLTVILKEISKGKSLEESKKIRKRYQTKGIINYFGLIPPNNSARGTARYHNELIFSKTMASEEKLSISKALLKRQNNLTIRSDLIDSHFYIFKKETFFLMISKTKMSSIQTDFLPYFMKLNIRNQGEDRVFGYLVKNEVSYIDQISNVNQFLQINREVQNLNVTPKTPWKLQKTHRVESKDVTDKNCLIGENVKVGEGTLLKDCIIGENVTIGENCRLNNCVIMKDTKIKHSVVLQSTIVCNKVLIKENSQLIECQIASNTIVNETTNAKYEIFIPEDTSIVTF